MYQFTQVKFIKRNDYYDVVIYYSKDGEKFRPNTGVKVSHKHLTKAGLISTSHPNFDEDSKTIKTMQNRVEDIIASYHERYGEKPSVEWVEKQFDKPLIDARKDLQDALCYWKEFIAEKEQTTRNPGTIKRYNNLEGTLTKFRWIFRLS